MNWISIASMVTPLTFNKFDWFDVIQGGSAALGIVALMAIVGTLYEAWRRRGSQNERND